MKNRILLKWIFLLVTLSVSFTIVPTQGIISYNSFGGIYFSNEENQETREIGNVKKAAVVKLRGKNEYNPYLLFLAITIILIFIEYQLRLPKYETMVDYKVRMDN